MNSKSKPPAGALHLLTAKEVQAAGTGDYPDGGGLVLRVGKGAGHASYVFRYTAPAGKRREMGLGPAHRSSVAQTGKSIVLARDLAHRARELLRHGHDPIEYREAQRAAARAADEQRTSQAAADQWTLARAARDYHERVIEPKRSPKHAAQWLASLENHVPASLWQAPIATIEPPALFAALLEVRPHERARNVSAENLPETVQRMRQRLDAIFEDAIFHKRCTSNPAAAIKRKMREASGKRDRGAFRALPYKEAPALMARLRVADGVAAKCLEFTVLTVARTSEALLATWPEIDLDAKTWAVPKKRMKAKEPHTVYLPARAIDILKTMQGVGSRYVFPTTAQSADKAEKPLSNMAMLVTLDRLGVREKTTVHGLARATFSTWANETGAARPDVIEACLAHEEGNKVRAAYNRATFNEERRALLAAWADYLAREPAQVIDLQSKRA